MSRTPVIVSLSLSCLLTVVPVHSMSLDKWETINCDHASSKMEKAICTNEELSNLDDQLNEAYRLALKSNPKLKSGQTAWLKNTAKCSDEPCLINAFARRLDEIKSRYLSNSGNLATVESQPGFVELRATDQKRFFYAPKGAVCKKVNGATQHYLEEIAKKYRTSIRSLEFIGVETGSSDCSARIDTEYGPISCLIGSIVKSRNSKDFLVHTYGELDSGQGWVVAAMCSPHPDILMQSRRR